MDLYTSVKVHESLRNGHPVSQISNCCLTCLILEDLDPNAAVNSDLGMLKYKLIIGGANMYNPLQTIARARCQIHGSSSNTSIEHMVNCESQRMFGVLINPMAENSSLEADVLHFYISIASEHR